MAPFIGGHSKREASEMPHFLGGFLEGTATLLKRVSSCYEWSQRLNYANHQHS